MKVLEKCSSDNWKVECRCTGKGNGDRGCGEKILVTKRDIYVTSRGYYKSSKVYYYTFRCPKCDRNTNILEKDIPKDIKDKAMEKYKELYMN